MSHEKISHHPRCFIRERHLLDDRQGAVSIFDTRYLIINYFIFCSLVLRFSRMTAQTFGFEASGVCVERIR